MPEIMTRPKADRRQLREIIAGLSEGVLLLDPDGTILWANEAALTAYGASTTGDLGASADEFNQRFSLRYRNHRDLSPENYPLTRLLAGDSFNDVIVEVSRPVNDDPGKRVHSLRGLVLTDAADAPDCLVLVINDVTERFSAEERFERTFNANPAPAVICNLADLRFIKVNQGFLDMTGYARDAVIGRSVYEIDVLENAENREDAVARLNNWQTIRQTEACLELPDGGEKPVIVAGQPIELDDAPCMLFTFMDLEPRKRAETLLRQSEERFAKAFRLAPVPMLLTTLDGFKILDVNDAFAAITGLASADAIGKTAYDLQIWEDSARRKAFEKSLRDNVAVRNFEARLRVAAGASIDCLISAEVVAIQEQDCVLSVMLDISERKRSEAELVAAIEAVMQDTSWFSQTVIEKLADFRSPPRPAGQRVELAALTAREREVLELICQGLSDQDIAGKLGLSRNTVRNHVATLYNKINVHRRTAAVVWGRERGITGPKMKHAKRR